MIKLFFSETKLNLTKTTHGKQYYFKKPFFCIMMNTHI